MLHMFQLKQAYSQSINFRAYFAISVGISNGNESPVALLGEEKVRVDNYVIIIIDSIVI